MRENSNKSLVGSGFMLKEYERIFNMMRDEGIQSEQRVTFFLSILSAALAVLGIIAQFSKLPAKSMFYISEGILLVLLLYALTILNRLNARDVQNNTYRKMLAEIQEYFSKQDPSIKAYFASQKRIFQLKRYKSKLVKYIAGRLRGTLGDLMILSTSLIITGMVLAALLFLFFPVYLIILWSCIAFFISLIVLNVIYDAIQPLLYTWES